MPLNISLATYTLQQNYKTLKLGRSQKYDWLVTWPPFCINIIQYERWPSDKADHIRENEHLPLKL